MTDLDRYNAFRAHIEAEIVPTAKAGLPVYYGNNRPTGRPDQWARFTIIDGSEDQTDTGAETNTFRTVGVGVFQVFVIEGTGEEKIRPLTDAIKTAFRKWWPTSDEIRVLRIDVDRDPTPDGAYMRRNVRIEFEHDVRF